jgi:type VI secretion system secreted protein VgrG
MTVLDHELMHSELSRLTQANRQLGIDTSLGRDALLLTSFTGSEEISRLFSFKLTMLSVHGSIDPKKIVGHNVTFWVRDRAGGLRHFNGFVSQFAAGPPANGYWHYSAEVVPWLWFLTQKTDCRTFVSMTVPKVIETIFEEHGFRNYEIHGLHQDAHPVWDYCVQYRESDFNFISRLMEQEGIYYYFRHENRQHVLVISDELSGYDWYKDREVEYSAMEAEGVHAEHITAWNHNYSFIPGSWSQTDYNFELPACSEATPAKILLANEPSMLKLAGNERCQVFDWPGEYARRGDGRQITRVRMEEEEAGHSVASGSSTCRRFTIGAKFTLRGHESPSEEGKTFLLTALEHSAIEPTSYSGHDGGNAPVYHNSFRCIPADVRFRPERRSPKPAIHGSQTAIVVGPRGEEIWPDKAGRVLVQFYWDRVNQRNGDNACWVRCVQSMAGKGWGSMFIPRIGQEVVVSFLEGDPDRPLVTGLVYNADQSPAYPLPQEKTKSYIKTCSSPGGDGFNEIRFEDKKGQEQIFIHAERNMDTRVRGSHMESIAGSYHLKVGSEGVGDILERAACDKITWVGHNLFTIIRAGCAQLVDGNQIQSTIGLHTICAKGIELNAEACSISAGRIQLRCGASSITLTKDGIWINAPAVNVNSGPAPFSLVTPEPWSINAESFPHSADSSRPGQVSTPWPRPAGSMRRTTDSPVANRPVEAPDTPEEESERMLPTSSEGPSAPSAGLHPTIASGIGNNRGVGAVGSGIGDPRGLITGGIGDGTPTSSISRNSSGVQPHNSMSARRSPAQPVVDPPPTGSERDDVDSLARDAWERVRRMIDENRMRNGDPSI